nr:rhomboid family intramembrane serine protease [Propionibacterium sp.]
MSRLWPERSGDAWARIGRLEVTSVMAVVLLTVAGWLVWVVVPGLTALLAFTPDLLLAGHVWRPFTWPVAGALGLFPVLNLVFFWYFGTELENQIGRRRMAALLVGIWASLTLAALVAGLVLPGTVGLAGIGLVEFLVLLLWVAEYPNRPLFFGIKSWVFGAVLLGLQLLLMVASRDAAGLVSLLLSLVLVAVLAKRQGLLTEYAFVPGGARPQRRRPARQTRAQKQQAKQATVRATDRERLDQLLDRINEAGIGALTDAERKELTAIRDRLRKG